MPLRGALRIGRDAHSDLVLSDARASRVHAELSPSGQGWVIQDLGSTHGTLVNGERIERHALRDGDRIQVGATLLTFSAEERGPPQEIVHQQPTADGPGDGAGGADHRLRIFYDVSRALQAVGDPDEILGRLLGAILDALGCERAVAGLSGAAGAAPRQIARRADGAAPGEFAVGRGILEVVLERREGVILRGVARPGAPAVTAEPPAASAMAAPLAVGTRLFGYLYVDDRRGEGRFGREDLDFLIALGRVVAAALDVAERCQRAEAAAEAAEARAAGVEIVGESAPMRRLKAQIGRCAASSASVLIRGESGTGKELVARALHAASPRADRPFVAVNCAAIPEGMVESELFGHRRGAFTGALRDRRGSFALADRGTLFLDEIGDLSVAAQAKVLRAIQEGEVLPVGAERAARVDVRILAATHKDLAREIEEGRFREDLYYRLNVVELFVPPLCERGEDIELLARALLCSTAVDVGKRRLEGLSPAALAALRRYRWPGNVRELRNEMERAAIMAEGVILDVGDLSARIVGARPSRTPPEEGASLAERYRALETTEQRLVEEACRAARGNLCEAARLLGISRSMMRRRIERFSGPERESA